MAFLAPPPSLPQGVATPGAYGDNVLLAFGNVAIAEIFDKTWFLLILVSLKINKWLALAAGYMALAVHVGIAAAIGYGTAHIPGLKQFTLNFITAGVLLLFALMYAWEAFETDPNADLIQEGKEEAEESFDDREASKGPIETPLPPPPPADAAAIYWQTGSLCPQCWCPAPRRRTTEESPEGSQQLCPDWKWLHTTRKSVVEWCGGRANSDARGTKKGEGDGLLPPKAPRSPGIQRLANFATVFFVVFLAEWGDRTQIVMIGLHASHPLSPIVVGSLLAFLLLSISAVAMAAYLATKRLNARVVRAVIAVSFFVFAGISLNDGLQSLHNNQFEWFNISGRSGNSGPAATLAR